MIHSLLPAGPYLHKRQAVRAALGHCCVRLLTTTVTTVAPVCMPLLSSCRERSARAAAALLYCHDGPLLNYSIKASFPIIYSCRERQREGRYGGQPFWEDYKRDTAQVSEQWCSCLSTVVLTAVCVL